MKGEHGFGGVAMFDQRQAEAINRLRDNKRGFVLFTIADADDNTLSMKYVGSMDDRLGPTFLISIIETAREALAGYVEDSESDEADE